MRLIRHHPWPRLLLAAMLLLAQLGAPAHALTMRVAGADSIAALLADPAAYCHSGDQTTAPDQPGPAQTPMSHGDCLACGACQMASAAPLMADVVGVPIPVLTISIQTGPARRDRVGHASASPTPPARAPPTSV